VTENLDMPRPLRFLREVNRLLKRDKPWRIYDDARAQRRALGGWPAWCFCPMDAVSSQARRLRLPTTNSSHHLAALAAWRATQGIYRFDDTLLDELWHTPIHGELPTELLYRMPEWCMYIEVGRKASIPEYHCTYDDEFLHGFFVFLNYQRDSQSAQLWFLCDFQDDTIRTGMDLVAIELKGTFEEGLGRLSVSSLRSELMTVDSSQLERLANAVAPLVSITLYLCSEQPDLRDRHERRQAPAMPAPIVTRKHGERLQPATQPTHWNVGYRLGAAIRKARQQTAACEEHEQAHAEATPGEPAARRRTPIGHVRRAHWHTFWTGPMDRPEERRRILKWLPPIPVNLDDWDSLVATVRPVK
jgi:hypothetical protein